MNFSKNGAIGVIRIQEEDGWSGSDVSNVAASLADACTHIAEDGDLRVLVVFFTGSKRLKADDFSYESFEQLDLQGSIVEKIAGFYIPTIIGMDGYVIGQFLELALAFDIRFATPHSYFGFPEINAGRIPYNGGTQRLPRLVGKGRAIEMMLTGEMIDSESAHRMNLVHRILAHDDLHSAVMHLSQEMAVKSPTSLAYVKEAINKGMDLSLEQGLRLEADLYFLMHTTNDRREGINAFKEKRKPIFEGN
ncbi:MAG: enoyl-CoA hydratase-related protein [Syntrophaceae bacterium]|nr:enoyl-CoA hydratase-related protein [Syntrophaceae bacterium]